MQEYSQIVINALPLMLNQESKGKAAVTIASYMNAMLRNVKTEQDLKIFAQTLSQCKEFSGQNNLGGLNRTCIEWNHEGILKLQSMRGISNERNTSDSQMVEQVQQYLAQTRNTINQIGTIDTIQFEEVSASLDQLEASIKNNGNQHFTQEQIQKFLNEIMQQKEQIQTNYARIDDILDSSGMTR